MKGQEQRGYTRVNPLSKSPTRYDTDAGLIQELRQSSLIPFTLITLDLSIAPGAVGSPFQQGGYDFQSGFFRLAGYGRGVNGFGFTTATALTTRTIAPSAVIQVGIQSPQNIWFQKHNRGFRGEFGELWLSWAAQAATSMDLYVFKYDDIMAMSGEAAT